MHRRSLPPAAPLLLSLLAGCAGSRSEPAPRPTHAANATTQTQTLEVAPQVAPETKPEAPATS